MSGVRESASKARVAAAIALAALASSAGNAVVAQVTLAAGAQDSFRPLEAMTFVPLTVIGVVLAGLAWAGLRKLANGARLLRILVPAVIVISWVPDLIVGAAATQPGTSWTGVIGLMVMHLVVAAVTVPVLNRVLPIDSRASKVAEATR